MTQVPSLVQQRVKLWMEYTWRQQKSFNPSKDDFALVSVYPMVLLCQVPSLVQQRVKLWMEYTWRQQKSFNESHILDFLPLKMRTDLALQIHYRTLSKVKLFQDCDSGLLKASSDFT
jgi:hypothetical protein